MALDAEALVRELEQLRQRCAELQRAAVAPNGDRQHGDMERDLRQSRQMLQQVLDTIPARVFWKDVELRYLGCNRACAEDAGLSCPSAIVGKSDFELSWSDQAELYRADDRRVIDSGQPMLDYEEPQTTPDGGRIWLRTSKIPLRDVDGRVAGVLGTYEDDTARKNAELALRQSELAYRTLAHNLPCIVYRVHLRERNRTEFFNQALQELVGYSPEELVAGGVCTLKPLILPEDWPSVVEKVSRAIERDEPFELEYRLQSKSRGVRVVADRGRPARDSEGRLAYTDGVIFDVTERHRAEESRQRIQTQLEQTQRLESLGVLAGGIAHDFNNLLVGILGHADLALRDLSPLSPVRDSLGEIERTARRAADLCRQMLAYSGRGRFEVRPIDLGELVREMTHLLQVSISKKALLRLNLADHLPAVEADAAQLRQVLMNLVINASEAIGERSGVISVSTGLMDCDRSYLGQTWLDEQLAPGPYAYVEVADNGCGMDPRTLDRIFEPFFTTKFTGRGLGLAAVLGIVRGHRGAIKVYSEPGQGTTFKFLLPVSPRPGATAGPQEAAPESWRRSATVLLVDDEETVRTLGKQMLERFGLTVLLAADGRSAVEVFAARHADIACVILDLTMPHMDGEETFRELRRIRADVRVMLSSGYNEEDVGQRFVGKGVAAFLQKPYDLRTLSAKLRIVLGAATPSDPAALT